MKETEFTLRDGLKKGLRRFKTLPRNVDSLLECHNLAPEEKRLTVHEEITLISEE